MLVRAEMQDGLPTWRELVGDRILIEFDLQFRVNLTRGKFLFVICFELSVIYKLLSYKNVYQIWKFE